MIRKTYEKPILTRRAALPAIVAAISFVPPPPPLPS